MAESNPWWFGGRVPEELAPHYRRELFKELAGLLSRRQAVAITGLRRVGKSTLLYQLADHLISSGTKPTNLLYFSFDEKAAGLGELLGAFRERCRVDFRRERCFVFLDEVQKFAGWARELKKFYDLYPKLKFFVSGSEGVFLQAGSAAELAGRCREFVLPPLSFREFVEMREGKAEGLSPVSLKPLFRQFVEKGGFPEMVFEESSRELREYVRSAVVEKILFRDIPGLSGIREAGRLETLLELVATNPGMYLNYASLSQKLGWDRRVIQEYFEWLEKAFLVRVLSNYRGSRASQVVKLKRAYPADNAICFAFKPSAGEEFFGRLVETAVVNCLAAKHFWKSSHEVDAVVEGAPLEVKYASTPASSDLAGCLEFMRKFKARKGLVATKDEEKTLKKREGTIEFKPAWKLLLEAKS